MTSGRDFRVNEIIDHFLSRGLLAERSLFNLAQVCTQRLLDGRFGFVVVMVRGLHEQSIFYYLLTILITESNNSL